VSDLDMLKKLVKGDHGYTKKGRRKRPKHKPTKEEMDKEYIELLK
jgi:hypothetical protein